ncbi:MAG: RHS repeat domain-containing protein [Cyclobacteriaceae bacterium]
MGYIRMARLITTIAFVVVSLKLSAQASCDINSDAETYCVGKPHYFWVSPPEDVPGAESRFTWMLNGSIIRSSSPNNGVQITFPSTGSFTIQVNVGLFETGGGGGGGIQPTSTAIGFDDCSSQLIVDVTESPTYFSVIASPTVLYETGDVALSVVSSVPADKQQYLQWYSTPAGYYGSGMTMTATGVSVSTTFNLVYTGPECYVGSGVFVPVTDPPCPITTDAISFCKGNAYEFTTSAVGNIYTWYLNGVPVDGQNGPTASIYLPTSRYYQIYVGIDEGGGGGGGGIFPTSAGGGVATPSSSRGCIPQELTVYASETTRLSVQASPTALVGIGDVQLSTSTAVPTDQQQYLYWSSSPSRYSGGGTTLNATSVNATTTFYLNYSGSACYLGGQVTVPYSTPPPPPPPSPCEIRSSASSSTYCTDKSYTFWVNPIDVEIGVQAMYTWTLGGVVLRNGPNPHVDVTFTSARTTELTVDVSFIQTGGGGGGGGIQPTSTFTSGDNCSFTLPITVYDSSPALIINATSSSLCSSRDSNVLLSVSGVPGHLHQYLQWSSSPSGFNGVGATLQANGLTQTTTFNLDYTGPGCYAPSSPIAIVLDKTEVAPLTVLDEGYRKSTISTAGGWVINPHYWQIGDNSTDLNRTSTDLRFTSNNFTASRSGFYYLRSFVASTSCWTAASSVVNVQVNTIPPLAVVSQIKRYGYNELYLTNDDIDRINQYATYYFVSSSQGIEINKPFASKSLAFEENQLFIRGKDNLTGTWGPTLTLNIVLRSDTDLNWVHTKSFDGTPANTILSESKSYFDQRGQALQSQTKTFHNNLPVVFASQSLKDKYDRTVGGTMSAPILQNDFTYNAMFARNKNGKPLSYADFDNADPLSTDQKGTLGNYYSAQNQWNEKDVPTAKRLFSRTDFYEDGTGEERKSSQPGDTHFIGSGREVLKGTFPVGNDAANELTDYLDKRAIVFGIPKLDKIEGVQTVVRDENERYVVSISDKSGKVLMTARKGTKPFSSSVSSDKMAYFYVLGAPSTTTQSVTITGTSDYVLENTLTNTIITKLTSALPHTYTLDAGFYRAVPTTGIVKVTYTNYFSDIAYQFYNDAGRLVVSVSPNGYEQWKSGTVAYQDIDKSTHTYNHQGWLLSMTEKDAGTTNYKYRRDGKIRFSQNAQQKDNETRVIAGKGRFSYTNYDDLGRPLESGEYKGSTLTYASLTGLEFADQSDYTLADKIDWVKTYYDFPVELPTASLPSGFAQSYVRGAVSCTENANTKTWYSYDELGRVTWMAQKPVALPFTFVTQYAYDFLGNVLTTYTKALNGSTEQDAFYHHYEYDKNKRLQKVYTSLDGTKKTLQAEYFYYLHGPLKRVVLATNLQGIDFVYNIHGWLTQINHPDDSNSSSATLSKDPGKDSPNLNGVRKDVFGMILEYYERSMTPIVNLLDPQNFHKLPMVGEEDQQRVAVQSDPITLYKTMLRTSMETLRNKNFEVGTKPSGSGGQ